MVVGMSMSVGISHKVRIWMLEYENGISSLSKQTNSHEIPLLPSSGTPLRHNKYLFGNNEQLKIHLNCSNLIHPRWSMRAFKQWIETEFTVHGALEEDISTTHYYGICGNWCLQFINSQSTKVHSRSIVACICKSNTHTHNSDNAKWTRFRNESLPFHVSFVYEQW